MLRDGFLCTSEWISVKFYGFPCFGMDFYGILWISMPRDGFLCNPMDFMLGGWITWVKEKGPLKDGDPKEEVRLVVRPEETSGNANP